MRLLHTTERRFQEFFDKDIPSYAILSHRWLDEEVSFQEMQYLLLDEATRSKFLTPALLEAEAKIGGNGHCKVLDFCKYAAAKKHRWVWIDTVCIDKSSSAELSEAINSMYNWYARADRCYVYLSDVRPQSQDPASPDSDFRRSKWWRRGWTLQELIAPESLTFLDSYWQKIGTKTNLTPLIHDITGIKYGVLLHQELPWTCPVASVMAWAADRETSRVEDMAYCLMGLLTINMPLLYGEGMEAFQRLCIKCVETRLVDDTILVHTDPSMYAASPSAYKTSTDVIPSSLLEEGSDLFSKDTYSSLETWKRGVQVQNALYCETRDGKTRVIMLKCFRTNGEPVFLEVTNVVGNIWRKARASSLSPQQRRRLTVLFDRGKADDAEFEQRRLGRSRRSNEGPVERDARPCLQDSPNQSNWLHSQPSTQRDSMYIY